MTESEWRECREPQPMLAFLRNAGKLSERKARLFAVACCRRVWCLLDQIGTAAVEVAERYADGITSAEELRRTENLAWWGADGLVYDEDCIRAAGWAAHAAVVGDAMNAANLVAESAGPEEKVVVQSVLLRDLFGPLPFRPVAIDPSLLEWKDKTIVKLARAAYQQRSLPDGRLDNSRLAVLGDALEEADCRDQELLEHLRGQQDHWRGCWVLDLVLNQG
jgi:hypothetical protein